MPAPTTEEISAARDRLRSGRAPGADGIPAEVIKRLSAIIAPITLLFTLMLRSATYPRSMGIALIRSLIKPGKPPGMVTSLRGIRLLCSMAAWFSHILDQRARQAWRAGKHQFGFKGNVGCMEAVAVLLALISSRTVKKQRLFVLWIDLRTAFPSLNRAVLIRRLFSYGISIGFCRLLLAIFDRTVSVVCIGNLLGKQFTERLGVREGAVESPHQFNAYIDSLRESSKRSTHGFANYTMSSSLYCSTRTMPRYQQIRLKTSNSQRQSSNGSAMTAGFSFQYPRATSQFSTTLTTTVSYTIMDAYSWMDYKSK